MDPVGNKYSLKNKKLLQYKTEMLDLDFYSSVVYKQQISAKHHFDHVYTLPFLDKEFCKELLQEIKLLEESFDYKGNLDEDESVRSPELQIAQICPELSENLLRNICTFGNYFFSEVFDSDVDSGSVHVTKYDKNWIGKMHNDLADVTVLIPLNENEFDGGGTEFKKGIIEPQEIGTATIFPSFITKHKGLSITSGERYLLVFWLKKIKLL